MKISVEINSKLVKGLLVTILVLAVLVLGKSLFSVSDVIANGFYEGPRGTYQVQHLGNYPDLHLFKRIGKRIECVGVCKVDEKTRSFKWVEYKKD